MTMKSTLQAFDERTEFAVPKPAAMNSLRHGLRMRSLVLHSEDLSAFQALRADLMRMWRPCTLQEQRCVNRIAACQWRMDRHAEFGAICDDKLDQVLDDPGRTAAQHTEPEPHYWKHRSTDCSRQEDRFERMMRRSERRLLELQRLRRHGLVAPGDRRLEGSQPAKQEVPATPSADTGCGQSDERGSAAVTVQTEATSTPAPAAAAAPEPVDSTASGETGTGKSDERDAMPVPAPQQPSPRRVAAAIERLLLKNRRSREVEAAQLPVQPRTAGGCGAQPRADAVVADTSPPRPPILVGPGRVP
jgi:hypothetical protein